MESRSANGSGMCFNGVFRMHWRSIPAGQERVERERFGAAMRSRCLRRQSPPRADDAPLSDEANEDVLERLERIEQKLDRLLRVHFQSPAAESQLAECWAVLSERGVDLRLRSIPDDGCARGALLHIKWLLPNIPDHVFECLARVQAVESLQAGWIELRMRFELVEAFTRDEIARAAFLAQRLGRHPSTSNP